MAKKASKTVEGNVLTVDFVDDTQVSCDLTKLPDEIKTQLALHGLSQKVGDSYAGADSIEAARAAAQRVVDDLIAGRWTAQRAGGGGGPRVTQLAEALARVATASADLPDMSIEEAVEVVSDMEDEQKKALRANAAIKAAMAEIKLERAKKEASEGGASLASLLG
jgi:hypothetical protein